MAALCLRLRDRPWTGLSPALLTLQSNAWHWLPVCRPGLTGRKPVSRCVVLLDLRQLLFHSVLEREIHHAARLKLSFRPFACGMVLWDVPLVAPQSSCLPPSR